MATSDTSQFLQQNSTSTTVGDTQTIDESTRGTPSDPEFLRLKNVTKTFGDNRVMDGMNLDMASDDRLVIIGPSGSGKSTLLRVLMGLESIASGEIALEHQCYISVGKDGISRASPKMQRKIGMVFQHYTLFPHLTVMSNLTLSPVKVFGVNKAEARDKAQAYLERLGVGEKADTYPSRLSGGQKQRVAIARALMLEPRLMLFDEVTSALDPEIVAEIQLVMMDLASQHMAMVIVTHDMGFAEEIATQAVFIAQGKVVEKSAPSEMFNHPREPRTQAFLDKILRHR